MEERYSSLDEYLGRYARAAMALAAQGYLLDEDLPGLLRQAGLAAPRGAVRGRGVRSCDRGVRQTMQVEIEPRLGIGRLGLLAFALALLELETLQGELEERATHFEATEEKLRLGVP